jgi:allantoinase
VDSHVHINEPGRTDWEGFTTATQAAASGGITTLIDMPLNCIPVTTSNAAFEQKLEATTNQLWVDVGFWGGVTPESLKDLPALLDSGILGVKSFMIDSGIEEFQPMKRSDLEVAMPLLAKSGLPYLFHAELAPESPFTEVPSGDQYRVFEKNRSRDWENRAIRLLLELTEKTKCKTHVVHLSSSDVLPEIARAKKKGIPFSVETCPHYLCLDSDSIDTKYTKEQRPLFKCCPPIRNKENQSLLWEGLKSGVIDFVVSDHSPCTAELKKMELGDLDQAWGGISSLQWALPLIWTEGRGKGFTLSQVSHWLSFAPARMAGLGLQKGRVAKGYDADFVVFDPEKRHVLEKKDIRFRNKISPYVGDQVWGEIKATYLRGQEIYRRDGLNSNLSPSPQGKPLYAERSKRR